MKIKGITESQLEQATREASTALYDGNVELRNVEHHGPWTHFKLRVNDCHKPGTHLGHQRRTVSACWHAHRDVMRAIFRLAPDALLVTALARYEGSEGFEHEFPATGYANVGSMMKPRARHEACEWPQVSPC